MGRLLDNFSQNPKLRELAEWVLALCIAAVVFLILRQFLFRSVNVIGISMEPALTHGERLIVTKAPYWFADPARGDVIAFPYKDDPDQKYIKRIVGLPGEVIDIVDYRVIVDDEPADGDITAVFGNIQFPFTVPDGVYFVLGDNRNASKDSRYHEVGCVPRADIIGKAVFRFWPPDRIGADGW
jgi:signal peptidase I